MLAVACPSALLACCGLVILSAVEKLLCAGRLAELVEAVAKTAEATAVCCIEILTLPPGVILHSTTAELDVAEGCVMTWVSSWGLSVKITVEATASSRIAARGRVLTLLICKY